MQIGICVTVVLLFMLPTQPCWLLISLLTFPMHLCLQPVSPSFPTSGFPTADLSPQLYFTVWIVSSFVPLCSRHHTILFSLSKPIPFFFISQCISNFWHLKVGANLKQGLFLLPYLLFVQQCDLWPTGAVSPGSAFQYGWVWPSWRSWHVAISKTKPSAQTDKTRPQSDLWTLELSDAQSQSKQSQLERCFGKLKASVSIESGTMWNLHF